MQTIVFHPTEGCTLQPYKRATFANHVWPNLKFFECTLDGNLANVDDREAYIAFLEDLPKTPLKWKTPIIMNLELRFLCFTKSHLQAEQGGCILIKSYQFDKVFEPSGLALLSEAKLAKYSGLLFTVYEKGIAEMHKVTVRVVDDVVRQDYVFTDGCGLISHDLMDELFKTLYGCAKEATAVQCRLPGVKGMVVVDRMSTRSISLTRSMVKLDVLKRLTHSVLPDGGLVFDRLPIAVLDYSKESSEGFLNAQVTLLAFLLTQRSSLCSCSAISRLTYSLSAWLALSTASSS
jgi:hypothetical protein